jgi:oxalate decarboxylase/phosphoglucose isomerase-like protein (cupin superfamily)
VLLALSEHLLLLLLHFAVLCCAAGKGHFSNAATGVQQALGPGDSIISVLGAASFAAGPVPGADSQQQQQQQQGVAVPAKQSSGPAWSHMLGWLQQLHIKQQHSNGVQQLAPSEPAAVAPAATQGVDTSSSSSSGGSSQLVMLQLLLPSELLTGEMAHHHAGHAHAVAQQLPWSSTIHNQPCSGSSSSSGSIWDVEDDEVCSTDSIHEVHVCGLLADAGLASSAHAEQSVQSVDEHQHQPDQQQHEHADSTSGVHDGSSSAPSSLRQQQCQKRALREVGAFQLPQQTNRLALLFGPHASPAVCCSFGVEAFEPGHVTPMHIHNTAHELFFVLAGKGEAVFGEGEDGADGNMRVQRVVLGPGDVAVFPPGVVHGVDNPGDSQLYCLQMMLPNEAFVEWVRSGQEAGSLDVSALQRLAAAASCG